MPHPVRKTLARLAVACLLGALLPGAHAAELLVSAAVSLSNAFREVGTAFEAREPGRRVTFNFAASDALVQQVARGAPVDLLATADQDSMDRAAGQNLLREGSRQNFAANRLVMVVPVSAGGPATLQALAGPDVKRIAVGNPDSVPAGRYARQALQKANLWDALQPKLIAATNVRQALDYVARGEVEAGFVYATDARAQAERVRVAAQVPVDAAITYPLAVLKAAPQPELARRFSDFLLSAEGRAILARHGFLAPEAR